ncbi:hypothetical protein HanPI659440_Chr14g0575301 [Helianthus annuus]|nr:hypothetical protein HanPI659440_Chr14g0575301 [Helianthus annuus]
MKCRSSYDAPFSGVFLIYDSLCHLHLPDTRLDLPPKLINGVVGERDTWQSFWRSSRVEVLSRKQQQQLMIHHQQQKAG